jgi:ribosomal subunit interface protein
MNLTIRGHHTHVDERFRELAEKKLARLERYLPRIDSLVVEVEHEETRAANHRFEVQIALRSGPASLRTQERGADPLTALELAADAMARQARRHKERLDGRRRSGPVKDVLPPTPAPVPVENEQQPPPSS